MARRSLLVLAIAGCGRIGFSGATNGDSGGSGVGDGKLGSGSPPNRVFISSGRTTGALGGRAGADAMCATAATNGGLAGSFIAWLSDASSNATAPLASSTGWVRLDGAPVARSVVDLAAGRMQSPIDIDESGARVTTFTPVWTGTRADGTVGTDHCSGWTTTTTTAVVGDVAGGPPTFTAYMTINCSSSAALYCFEIGNKPEADPALTPTPTAGRVVFISGAVASGGGIARFDNACAADASAAGLTGTFRAGVATMTTSIASRFTLDARPWVRPDGVVIAQSDRFFTGSLQLDSFVNQSADGTYVTGTVWIGSTSATDPSGTVANCVDWSATSGSTIATSSSPTTSDRARFWFNLDTVGCNSADVHVLCLEQ